MYKLLLCVCVVLGLGGCNNDSLAKLGLGCFMNGKLCFDSFHYSASIEKTLVLTVAGNKEYHLDPDGHGIGFWLECKAIDATHTICVRQFLTITLSCVNEPDIVSYDISKWRLIFYQIELNESTNPPYSIQELTSSQLDELNISRWVKRQSINPKQEILCSLD